MDLFVKCSQPQPQLHTRLTEFLRTVVCFILPFYMRTLLVSGMCLIVEDKRSRLLESSIVTTCVCACLYLSIPIACCCWFIWNVFNVFVSVYLCLLLRLLSLCVRYLSLTYSWSLSFSFCLLFLVLKDIRSFRFP